MNYFYPPKYVVAVCKVRGDISGRGWSAGVSQVGVGLSLTVLQQQLAVPSEALSNVGYYCHVARVLWSEKQPNRYNHPHGPG